MKKYVQNALIRMTCARSGPVLISENGNTYPAHSWTIGSDAPDNYTLVWFGVYGQVHHQHGPAVIYPDGTADWYLYNVQYTFDDFCKKLHISKQLQVEWKMKYT